MGALEDYVRLQRAKVKNRTAPMHNSVMSRAAEPQWQPEYEKEPGLEGSNPEDWIPNPKSIATLLGKLGAKLGGVGALGIVRNYIPKGPGPAVTAKSYDPEDMGALMDAIGHFSKPKTFPGKPEYSDLHRSIMQEAPYEGSKTHVLFDRAGAPVSVYQKAPGEDYALDGDYLAYLMSLNGPKGAGRQALADARQSGTDTAGFISTPKSQPFYDRLLAEKFPGLRQEENKEFGGTIWHLDKQPELKQGGLVQMKECNCGH